MKQCLSCNFISPDHLDRCPECGVYYNWEGKEVDKEFVEELMRSANNECKHSTVDGAFCFDCAVEVALSLYESGHSDGYEQGFLDS